MSTVQSPPAASRPASGARAEPSRRRPPQGFDRPRFLRVFTGIFFIVLFAPIGLVILFSFNSSRSLQDFEGFSLRWYEQFFESPSLRDSLIASVEIALVTMVVATVLGTLLAYGLVRARTRWSDAANVLMLVPLVTPEIVAGVSAPTSLAVDLAARTGLTLLGFLRDQRANVYTGLERVHDAAIG